MEYHKEICNQIYKLMADISKCSGVLKNGDKCPWADTCYRFLAPISKVWQSWIETPGYIDVRKNFDCLLYWEVKDKDNEKHTRTKS